MKLASIERIRELKPHPNADRLELATVLGWQCVVKKGDFTAGDPVVFVPIDTILPDAPWSAFLKKGDSAIRLRTVKLRGEYSQGLVLPLSVLPENVQGWHEGADVGGALGVRKYEKEIPAVLSGVAAGSFPSYLAPKTDEDNGLSNPGLVAKVLGGSVDVTLKLDGSSGTVIVDNGVITHVCSRNLAIVEDEKNAFWRAAKKARFDGFTGVVQGELMGPGIQGNQLELLEPTLYVFQIQENGEWLDVESLHRRAAEFGLRAVPIQFVYSRFTLEQIQGIADALTLPNGKPAEGVVVRPSGTPASGVGRPLGFKIINRNYGE
jgi:RNA ligase (TIGR02306 family)